MISNVGEITTETRARNVCFVGLVLQVVLSVCLLFLYASSQSIATVATARFFLGGVIIWLVLLILYQQRRHVAQEALETEQLRRDREDSGSGSIFELEQEDFLVAQRRLRWMIRWVLPTFVVLTALYLLLNFVVGWQAVTELSLTDEENWKPIRHASRSMLFAAGVAFVAFLFSRYVSGMSRQVEYRLIRSASIYLFGNALVGLLLTVCLGLASTGFVVPERVLAIGVRYLMLILGLEFLAHVVLDLYRPRVADQLYRPAFESRLVGMISEPGGIAKSIADAVNYQFGFEVVSATWFYKMLEQSIVPLAAVSLFVLLAMTSVTVVDADELAVIERFGRPIAEEPIGPGLHFKRPWPWDRVRKAKVGLIKVIVIGEAAQTTRPELEEGAEEVLTWTEEHKYLPSVDVLVAVPPRERAALDSDQRDVSTATSILRISMPIQYRVKPERFFDYLYRFSDPQAMLRDIGYRELIRQAVHFDYKGIMAGERGATADRLHSLIQERCDEMNLGLEIVYVGLRDIHPPTENDVAATFQKVATAGQERETLIQSARVQETKELVSVAGSVKRAADIYSLIQLKEALEADDLPARQSVDEQIDRLMLGDPDVNIDRVKGEAGQALSEAQAYAQYAVNRAVGKVNTFKLELIKFQASPRLYRMRKILQSLSDELDDVRKYVLVVDPKTTKLIIELNEQASAGLEIIEAPAAVDGSWEILE